MATLPMRTTDGLTGGVVTVMVCDSALGSSCVATGVAPSVTPLSVTSPAL